MKLQNILFMAVILMTLVSCKQSTSSKEPSTLHSANVEVNFNDGAVDSVIREYIKEYEISPIQKVLELKIYRDPIRDLFYLSQVRSKRWITDNVPDYFYVHGGQFIVLLQLGGNKFHTSKDMLSKLNFAMEKIGVVLEEDSLDYNPPVWEFIKTCEGRVQMRDKSNFVFNYLPCGYAVKQDSIRMSEYSLVKR